MANPLLCLDVGNSRTKFGLFPSGSVGGDGLPECTAHLAIPHGQVVDWANVRARLSLGR